MAVAAAAIGLSFIRSFRREECDVLRSSDVSADAGAFLQALGQTDTSSGIISSCLRISVVHLPALRLCKSQFKILFQYDIPSGRLLHSDSSGIRLFCRWNDVVFKTADF